MAILPQLFQLQRITSSTPEAIATITPHYLCALGAYRALYLVNWLVRYMSEGYWDPIATCAGLIQTVLYADFFYIYVTRCVCSLARTHVLTSWRQWP